MNEALILEHYQHPKNYGTLMRYNYQGKAANPYCGDELQVFAQVENGTIKDVSYTGSGCSICLAAMSYLSEKLLGLSLTEAKKLRTTVILEPFTMEMDHKRVPCALLSLQAVQNMQEVDGGV